MAKQYKIKRGRRGGHTYRARPHPITVVLSIVGIAALIFIGISIYDPVYDFIMNLGKPSEPQVSQESSLPVEESSAPVVEPEPDPEPEPPQTVDDLRAAYLPPATAADSAALSAFLTGLPEEVNAILLDVKNSQGQLLYRSAHPKAIEWEAVAENAIDLKALAGSLQEQGYHLIARMQTFSDPICARGDRANNAIKYQNSDVLWLDNYAENGGKPWSNPYTPEVRSYLTGLAVELSEQGAAMVVLDGVRFPDDMTGSATFGTAAQGIGRDEILRTFLTKMEEALEPLGTRCALQLSATAINHYSKAARYGGNPLSLGANNVLLAILPEELATGYLAEGVLITRPALDPAATVTEVLAYARGQSSEDITLIPLLRGSPAGEPALSAEQLANQLEASKEHAGTEYILYAADGNYSK